MVLHNRKVHRIASRQSAIFQHNLLCAFDYFSIDRKHLIDHAQ